MHSTLAKDPRKPARSSIIGVRRAVTISVGLLSLLVASSAFAQSVAVLDVGGTSDVALRAEISDILLDAVENNPALTATDRRDLSSEEALLLLGCSQPNATCMEDLTLTLEVDRVVFSMVDDTSGTVIVRVVYFDSEVGMPLMDEQFAFNNAEDRTNLEMRLAAVISNRIVLEVVSDRSDVDIYVDGDLVGTAPVISLDLRPGRHTLEGRCGGCEETTLSIDLENGRYYTEHVNPAEAVVVALPPVVEESSGPNIVPIITIASGGALLLTGMTFGILTNTTQTQFDETNSITEAEDLADKGDTYALLANIFLATGAAVTVTGIILMFTMDGGDEVDTSQTAGVQAAPWVGPRSGGVVVDWTF